MKTVMLLPGDTTVVCVAKVWRPILSTFCQLLGSGGLGIMGREFFASISQGKYFLSILAFRD
ncbi:hypothetical protein M758_2G178700 [Ceratodon purpureus]|uniref:Uncharacterized protein n=1 Tax=Ceratodon purpureus TaxID=3225 RepID=A0A8T0IWX3_CERPU|nr:hypothetical protein KC19_2G226700 [Ceratodon purpureus]KAG0627163.1 hypothetical protein M758_2G178700 [Ceratodon purpureus]